MLNYLNSETIVRPSLEAAAVLCHVMGCGCDGSTEVQNPRRKLYEKCLCSSYMFGSVLACMCKVCSRVSEALLLTNNSFSDNKAFLHFIAFSGSPTAVHRPYDITLWTYLSEPLVKDSHIRLSSTEKQHCVLKSLNHTLPLRTCYGEVYGNIAREENG